MTGMAPAQKQPAREKRPAKLLRPDGAHPQGLEGAPIVDEQGGLFHRREVSTLCDRP